LDKKIGKVDAQAASHHADQSGAQDPVGRRGALRRNGAALAAPGAAEAGGEADEASELADAGEAAEIDALLADLTPEEDRMLAMALTLGVSVKKVEEALEQIEELKADGDLSHREADKVLGRCARREGKRIVKAALNRFSAKVRSREINLEEIDEREDGDQYLGELMEAEVVNAQMQDIGCDIPKLLELFRFKGSAAEKIKRLRAEVKRRGARQLIDALERLEAKTNVEHPPAMFRLILGDLEAEEAAGHR
jgi:hypothetical protein